MTISNKNEVDISIIIVHYNVKKELFDCINSIYKSKPKVSFEIIVVDNDEVKVIEKDLKIKFPQVLYVKNSNNGWGGGVNKGLEYAKGKYIYLLNPDTLFINNALDKVYEFAKNNSNVGVVSSLLFDKNKKIYPLQGTKLLNPLNAIFSLSFINKFFPNNLISKKFWMRGWNKNKIMQVESATLSAALIKKDLLIEVGKFDENFFLYYEEYDLAKRLKKLGYKNFIVPTSKVIHFWEVSTKKTGRTSEFIEKSRKYYFEKHYGRLAAYFVEFFLSFDKKSVIKLLFILGILLVASFLRLHKISEYSPFIGDQAWFYISARDMLVSGQIPLLGITSSHTWIHQGPLWTYILAPALLVSGFNPISGVYLSAGIGILTVLLAYVVGNRLMSYKFGLIFSFIFAVSPLVVFHSRFAYHTTPIPLFVLLLLYFMSEWIKGKVIYFPLILLTMSILYNFELATVIFWSVIILYLLFGFVKKKSYFKGLLNRRIISLSLFGLLLPIIPVLIYDIQNGFPQTIVFGGWFFYKFLQFLGFFEKSFLDESSLSSAFDFFFIKYGQLTVSVGKIFLYAIFFASLLVSLYNVRLKLLLSPFGIVMSLTWIGVLAYFISGVPSEAYLVMLFPGLLFMFSLLIYQLRNKYIILGLISLIGFINIESLVSTNYLTKNTFTMEMKISAAKQIKEIVGNRAYVLKYEGAGEEFESSVMPYEYLVWWLGNKENEGLSTIVIEENSNGINIQELSK